MSEATAMSETWDPRVSELVTSREVAYEVGLTIHGVLDAIRGGRLQALRIGGDNGHWVTTWAAVDQWSRGQHHNRRHRNPAQPTPQPEPTEESDQ